MAEPCTVIYVVGLHNQPGKLLGQIVLLIAALGRGEEGKAIALVAIQFSRHQTEGLLPGCRHQFAVFPDERHSEPLRALHEAETKAALDAELAVVGQAVAFAPHPHYPVVQDAYLYPAAHAAVGANRVRAPLRPLPFLRAGEEGAGGADIDTCAAELAVRVLQRFGAYPVQAVKIGIAGEDAFAAHLLAGTQAAAAQNAEIVIAVKEGLS